MRSALFWNANEVSCEDVLADNRALSEGSNDKGDKRCGSVNEVVRGTCCCTSMANFAIAGPVSSSFRFSAAD